MCYQINGDLVDLTKPKVMGILNLTSDSFYDGGQYLDQESIVSRIKTISDEGADIIDIGAASSKPGSQLISSHEEWHVLKGVITTVKQISPKLLISIDTYNADTAEKALGEGVEIINDISGGEIDSKMFDVVGKSECIYIAMHMQGLPDTMQLNPKYENVTMELLKYFQKKLDIALSLDIQLIIDPGFGFGKSLDHNYDVLNKLEVFSILDLPILVGLSRKSMIYKLIGETPKTALPGTLGLSMIALQKGASILRVHDVAETVQLVKVFNKLDENKKNQ